MQKKVKLTILIFLLLVLTSCSMPDISSISSLFGSKNIATGKGVKLEFTDYPKGDLTDKEQFRVMTRVSNFGNSPIDGVICLSDTPSSRNIGIPSDPSASCVDIHLDTAETLSAGKVSAYQQDIAFPNEVGSFYYYDNIQKDITQTSIISAHLKYAVDSKSAAQICVKSMNANVKNIPVPCEDEQTLTDIKQPDFPIQITKIEKDVSSVSPTEANVKLKIYVSQKEEGQAIPRSSIFEQVSSFKPEVEFKPGFIGGSGEFTCTPLTNGKFELRENEKVINCRATVNIGQEYLYDTFVVELGYGFEKVISLPPINLISSQSNIA